MPKPRPPTSGYARIAQAEEYERHGDLDDSSDEDPYTAPLRLSSDTARYAPIQPQRQGHLYPPGPSGSTSSRRRRPGRSRAPSNSSGVDIKAINARLERWAEEIASKFKITKFKGKTHEEEQLEIHHSVFRPPEGMRPKTSESLTRDLSDEANHRMTKLEFEDIVESVRTAIELGFHPKMITQGSSGSYFARNSEGKVVGVFKPKDEEPYASKNPKWTKWIHRNLFPCFFGRACLIPNLSYVSEAAAYVLDSRLGTNLVPYTDIVWLSSKSFSYDFWDRRSYYLKGKPLPAKIGSFQVFLRGFKDANVFLKEHPWPDHYNSGFNPDDAPRRKKRTWSQTCRPTSSASDDDDRAPDSASPVDDTPHHRFAWTETLQQAFREELEKLVILDYIMRNTDRGLDNWMVKVDWEKEEVSIVSDPPKLNGNVEQSNGHIPSSDGTGDTLYMSDLHPYKRQEAMSATSRSGTPSSSTDVPSISLGAIDNSLSWPWKHPDAWRSFPFGWLFLPVSLIGRPFSQKTRDHFLPLLTSTAWWSETQMSLRRIFSQDSDFKESMFARQIAVMKGQAWNVVETLKTPDHGPLELTRRTRVCVWDDLVNIPVAIPLRVPSSEMRRRREAELRRNVEEEMDIGSASAPAPQFDLLGPLSPSMDMPSPHRFELSRDPSIGDLDQDGEDVKTPATGQNMDYNHFNNTEEAKHRFADDVNSQFRPGFGRSGARSSFEQYRKLPKAGGQRRRLSHSERQTNTAFLYDGDDLEGDLGYALATDMEGSQRKVIVERLETVKSKNPVFTWC
ncbi:MAG: phosphatidyl inositol kinase [Cirrosporium novae-zelandiae]|nr:MAG: phosphatidyl inositol kinase [Cirrosporium novae-zelandiae]